MVGDVLAPERAAYQNFSNDPTSLQAYWWACLNCRRGRVQNTNSFASQEYYILYYNFFSLHIEYNVLLLVLQMVLHSVGPRKT